MKLHHFIPVGFAVCLLPFNSQVEAQTNSFPASATAAQRQNTSDGNDVDQAGYRISPGDSVEFKFTFNQELNEVVTVRPDGFLSLAMIGDVAASGETPESLSQVVSSRYVHILRRPQVAAIMRTFSSQRVFVTGEVFAPGVVPIGGHMTLTQAVVSAGGIKPTGCSTQVLLLRYGGSNTATVIPVSLKNLLKGKAPDILLTAYDVVYVPRTRIAQVGTFVEQYINNIVPRSLYFPYNVHNVVSFQSTTSPQ